MVSTQTPGGQRPDGPEALQARVSELERQLERAEDERDAARRTLHDTETRLQAILEATISGVLVVDRQGKVTHANRRFAEIWGIPDAILQSGDDATLLQFVLDRLVDPQAFLAEVERLYRTTEQSHDILGFKDGAIVERVSLPLIEDGQPNGRVWSFTDVTERRRAEEALRLSEEKYRRLFHNSVVGQFRIGVGGKVLDANLTMARMFGWEDLESFVEQCSMAGLWVHQADRDRMYALMKERGQIEHFETEFYRKDGSTFPLRVSSRMYWDLGYQLGICIDISKEKEAFQALKESEKKFRSLADSTSAEIAITANDRFLYANKATLERAGLSWEEFSRLVPGDTLSPEAADAGGRAVQAAVERGEDNIRFEYLREGRWNEVNGSRITIDNEECWIWTAFDITEHKLAQERLRLSEDRYRAIFETTGTGTIIFDDDAVIGLANEEWASLTGYSREELEGKMTWMDFFTGESLERMKGYHALRAREPSAVPRTYEAQMRDREGKLRDGIVTISVVPGTTQRVGSFLDMTELKRAQRQMYRADKMAALGQIIAGVAHEINNPNNFIYFNLPILRRYVEVMRPLLQSHLEQQPDLQLLNMPLDVFLEDVFKLLENMQHGSERITSIVTELKTYVRGDEEVGMKDEAVGAVIRQVMTLIGKQVRKMVKRFEVEIADDIPAVRINAGRIEQVLINLIINAGQAADKDDSWIRVTTRVAADRRSVEIVVQDNGTGIPADALEQIFQPFYTSKSREAGSGLGLSISQQIVEEHDGSISVESEPGQGTTFTVTLPVAEAE